MKSKTTYIDNVESTSKVKIAKRRNWRIEMLKKVLAVIQYLSPQLASRIIWNEFTKPRKARFNEAQIEFIKKAERSNFHYKNQEITVYRWGTIGPKILLVHGWGSKMVDFRKMIESLVSKGYIVEGMDMKAHGNSTGKRTALPEFRDLVLHQYDHGGPYHAVIGYSLGGIAAGVAIAEREHKLPERLFIISAPPFVRYFFKETVINQAGCGEEVYEAMCDLVQKNYGESIDYFDLRDKSILQQVELHLIYDKDDQVVSIEKGRELKQKFPLANWLQSKGAGHYKIIASSEIIQYVTSQLEVEKVELVR